MNTEELLLLVQHDVFMKILLCVLLIVAGICAHFIIKRYLTRALERYTANKLINSKKMNTLLAFSLSTIRYIVYFLVFYLFCKILNLPVDSLFIAIAGASSVAFGLGAQTLIKNVINGFFILLENQYSVGDFINIGEYRGVVEEVGIRTTRIKSIEGNVHIVPNGDISVITNMTQSKYPTIIDINLPYEADADMVIITLNNEMDNIVSENIDGLMSRPTVLGISSFGSYYYTVKILVESMQDRYLGVERQVRLRIKRRLDKEGVPLPSYPQPPFKQ